MVPISQDRKRLNDVSETATDANFAEKIKRPEKNKRPSTSQGPPNSKQRVVNWAEERGEADVPGAGPCVTVGALKFRVVPLGTIRMPGSERFRP